MMMKMTVMLMFTLLITMMMVMQKEVIQSSTSLPRGNQVDGLPRVCSVPCLCMHVSMSLVVKVERREV